MRIAYERDMWIGLKGKHARVTISLLNVAKTEKRDRKGYGKGRSDIPDGICDTYVKVFTWKKICLSNL